MGKMKNDATIDVCFIESLAEEIWFRSDYLFGGYQINSGSFRTYQGRDGAFVVNYGHEPGRLERFD